MRRSIYLSIFVVLSTIAGWLYYSHTRQSAALVATHDLLVGTTIKDGDVTVRTVNPTSIAGQLLSSPDQAIGQVVSSPILEGSFVDARQIAPTKNAALLVSGLSVPTGERIIGLPVTPAAAVGGVLKAGDRVDVMAVASQTKATGLSDQAPATPVLLGKNVLVVGMRTDQGTSVDGADRGPNAGFSRPASVLLAIPQIDEAAYSAAIAGSTFVLTLSTD
jgi:Flp pilus assembly protein CpaB